MSLNYTTLQSTVLSNAHRSGLTTEVVEFIRRAEGMIARDLRAYPLNFTLDEDDRSGSGVYNLPSGFLELRAAYAAAADGSTYALENVGPAGIRMLSSTAPVIHYAVLGDTIEFRGVPDTDASIELQYLGIPDPLTTTATNNLLTNHEEVYISGALYFLYRFTQDLELAQAELGVFNDAIEKLNAQYGRRFGGGSSLPAYNFGHVRVGSGY